MNAFNGLMGFIYLTHLSIIPLTQLIIALFILFYLGGLKGKSKTSRLFTYFFVGNTLFLISFFLYNSVLPANQYWLASFTYIILLNRSSGSLRELLTGQGKI